MSLIGSMNVTPLRIEIERNQTDTETGKIYGEKKTNEKEGYRRSQFYYAYSFAFVLFLVLLTALFTNTMSIILLLCE